MKGSKKQIRPGVWRIWISLGRDEISGKYKYATSTFYGTEKEAEVEVHRLVGDREALRNRPDRRAFAGVLEDVFRFMEASKRSATTVYGYRKIARKHIIPAIGSKDVSKIGARDLDVLYSRMGEAGASPAYIRQAHAIIRRTLAQAVKWDWVKENVAEKATPPSLDDREAAAPTSEQVLAIVKYFQDRERYTYATYYLLAAATGARRSELCALRWSDVDFLAKEIRIERTLVYVPGSNSATLPTGVQHEGARGGGHKVIEKPRTKSGKVRRIALDDWIARIVSGQMNELRKAAEQAGGAPVVADPFLFFSSPTGATPVHPDHFTREFQRACEELKLPFHLHQLRHFAATTLIASGMDARTVASRLGHANANVTMKVYAHALQSKEQEAAVIMSRALGSGDR